ncbi:DMT family transporter [Inquilinus sp. CAU 1745]|uniref:DMT family transporter n=1 Tax=Inquilinus sp. CAU 1745 TaxID=3140369 RepID=UPI00325B193E
MPSERAGGGLNLSANLRGIALYTTGIFLGSLMDVLIKWLSGDYPILEIVFFRGLFALIPAVWLIGREGGIAVLRTNRPGRHLARGIIAFAGMALFFHAFSVMPLADAYAIGFSAPLMMTALSLPLLGEVVGPRRWAAVLVGFGGVLVVLWPDLGSGSSPADAGWVAALAGTACYAVAALMIRDLSRTDGNAAIVFYGTLLTVAFSAAALPFGFVMPTPTDALLLLAVGLLGGLTTIVVTMAFRTAEAVTVAPFEYTSMIWAVLFGALIWGDAPSVYVLAGSGIIIVTALYILRREKLAVAAET